MVATTIGNFIVLQWRRGSIELKKLTIPPSSTPPQPNEQSNTSCQTIQLKLFKKINTRRFNKRASAAESQNNPTH
jgi:hypothetical protein